MKYCRMCHAENEDTSKFCKKCGAKFEDVPPVDATQDMASQMPNSTIPPFMTSAPTMKNMENHDRVQEMSDFCGKGIFLVFTVLFTVGLVLEILLDFQIWMLLLEIPAIVIAVGMWLIFGSAMKKQLRETGFTLISGAIIAKIVFIIIPVIVAIFSGIVLLVGEWEELRILGVIIIIFALLIGVFGILFWFLLRRTVVSARDVLRRNYGVVEVNLFVLIMLGIDAAFKCIQVITVAASSSYLGILSSYCYDAAYNTGFDGNEILNAVMPSVQHLIITAIAMAAVAICQFILFLLIREKNKQNIWY